MKEQTSSDGPARRGGRTGQNRAGSALARAIGEASTAPREPVGARGLAQPFPFEALHELARQRLNAAALRLFQESTGLRLHLHWQGPLDFGLNGSGPLLCPRALRRRRDGEALSARCQDCLRQYWDASGQRRCFAAPCGAMSCWSAIEVGAIRLGKVVMQAPRGGATFQRAVAFLEMLLHDLSATVRAELAEQELAHARRQLPPPSNPSAPPPREPPAMLPPTTPAAPGRRARQVAEQILKYIQAHYGQPLQLADLAAEFKLNSSYISALLSRTIGIPFHRYLDELRLAKAKELLREPTHRVSEAARAAGYANPNHFRSIFKVREGVSPSQWRENSPPAAPRPSL